MHRFWGLRSEREFSHELRVCSSFSDKDPVEL